jgi:hypothetical protein
MTNFDENWGIRPRGAATRRTLVPIVEDRDRSLGAETMWDTISSQDEHLSHDLPCQWCGHAGHLYLPCDDGCGCRAHVMPGAVAVRVG